MSKNVSDLLGRLNVLRSKYGERDARYLANWNAYCGDYDKIYSGYTIDALTVAKQGQQKDIEKWNLVRPIVDTHKVLINQLPNIAVPSPELGVAAAGMKADKIEKVLYAWWDTIRIKRKHGETAFNLALNWASVWQAAWDEENEMPTIFVRSPGESYPVMKRGGEEVSYCFFRWEEETDELVENYPEVKELLTRNRVGGFSNSKIEVIEYVDATERLMIIGGDVKSLLKGKGTGGDHQLNLCPVVITPAAFMPGELFPPGPVDQLVGMNDYLNRFQTKLGDAIEETLFGWHTVSGEGANDVAIDTGPGATIRLEGMNLKHEYTQPQAPPSQAFGHIDVVQRYMRLLGMWPDSASGESDGSVITGKAVARLQGVMAAQLSELQSNLGDSLEQMNTIALKMFETYRPNKVYTLYATEPVTVSSSPGRKRNFTVTFTPKEDFQEYYKNTLNYSPFGTDMNASIQIGMQLVDARIFPRSWLRNLIPGGSDADGMAKEIKEEDQERAIFEADLQVQTQQRIMQAQAQQQAQTQGLTQGVGGTGQAPAPSAGTAPTQSEGGLPPQTSPSPAAETGGVGGSMIGGNAMLMPGGQPQMLGIGEPLTGSADSFPIPYTPLKPYGPAMAELAGTGVHGQGATEQAAGPVAPGEQPGPDAITFDDAEQILGSIAKLKGKLYLMGDIVERGFTDGQVEVGVTQAIDKATVTNAVRNTPLYGRISFQTNIPTTGSVEVTASQTAEVQ